MKDKIIDLYETASLLVVHVGRYGEIDSRHALISRLSNALHALDGGVHNIECLKDLSALSSGVVGEMVEALKCIASVDKIFIEHSGGYELAMNRVIAKACNALSKLEADNG